MEEDFKKYGGQMGARHEPSRAFSDWDTTFARLAYSATVPFLLLQLPQIILNAQNLHRGKNFALFAVPWMARLGKLPPKAKSITGSVSAWTPTLLFIGAAMAQWWQNNLYHVNVRGLSLFTILLAMIGHSLLLPRALSIRDLTWFVGPSSGALLQGWAILVRMYLAVVISNATFWSVSAVLFFSG